MMMRSRNWTSLGLKIEETIEQEHDDIAEGFVIRTNPQAGKVVKAGTAVTIYKSIGKKKVAFENYVGEQIADVEPQLRSENICLSIKKKYIAISQQGRLLNNFRFRVKKLYQKKQKYALR